MSVLSRAPRRVDLTLSMSHATFLGLLDSSIGPAHAVQAKLVQWTGDADAFDAFTKAVAAHQSPFDEE